MEFKVIESAKDPLFNEALKLYDDKLDIGLDEDSKIFKRSLENNKTENDYAFIVGIENQTVVSLATAHTKQQPILHFNLLNRKRKPQS